jgi:hypothetical protein
MNSRDSTARPVFPQGNRKNEFIMMRKHKGKVGRGCGGGEETTLFRNAFADTSVGSLQNYA